MGQALLIFNSAPGGKAYCLCVVYRGAPPYQRSDVGSWNHLGTWERKLNIRVIAECQQVGFLHLRPNGVDLMTISL